MSIFSLYLRLEALLVGRNGEVFMQIIIEQLNSKAKENGGAWSIPKMMLLGNELMYLCLAASSFAHGLAHVYMMGDYHSNL